MKLRKIFIFLLISLYFVTLNVYAIEDDYISNSQSSEEIIEDSEYLPPVDTSGYDISNDTHLEGGGTFFPYEIWIFRIVVALIIGSGIFLYKRKKDNKNKVIENDFYNG